MSISEELETDFPEIEMNSIEQLKNKTIGV